MLELNERCERLFVRIMYDTYTFGVVQSSCFSLILTPYKGLISHHDPVRVHACEEDFANRLEMMPFHLDSIVIPAWVGVHPSMSDSQARVCQHFQYTCVIIKTLHTYTPGLRTSQALRVASILVMD